MNRLRARHQQIRELHVLCPPLITLCPSPLAFVGMLEKFLFEAIATI